MDPAAISKAGRSVAGNGASRSQARVEGLLDGASLFLLPDEAAFEVLDEGQDAAVVVGECLFSHYRDEAAKFLPTAQECGELIGNAAVVLAGAFRADPGIHEPAERGQDINWWGDAAPVQFPGQHDLTFGDVAGDVGDRMRDVVVGHRENR